MLLRRMLVPDTSRNHMRMDGKAGMKTPLALRTMYHSDLEDFLVSDTSGDMILRPNSTNGVPSAFFRLDVDEEAAYQTLIADRIFMAGCKRGWGNVVLLSEFTDQDFAEYVDYFHEYDLELSQVFCGMRGFDLLRSSGRLMHPSSHKPYLPGYTNDSLLSVQESEWCAGLIHHRPVYYNPDLDPYLIFTSEPKVIGMLTRVGDFASVILHNPERGLIIARLDDELLEDNDDETLP